MKKFMAIVMCLAMALSMMTVVSFAADVAVGGTNVTAAPGDVVELPIYVTGVAATGMTQLTINVPFAFEIAGGLAAADAVVDGSNIIVYNDTGITYSETAAALIIKFTAPEAGDYTIAFVDDNFIIDVDYNDMGATFTDINVKVEEKVVVTDPTATTIDVPVAPTADNGVVTVFQVAGNATEFGVEYDGVKYPSLATAADLANYFAFAVELIGADGAITAYAK